MNQAKVDFIKKICIFFDSLSIDLTNKNLCVCLSGGADSVSLLRGLIEVKDKYRFNLSACHFNHMIRGEEADNDELFCKDLCNKFNIKIFCGRDDVPAYSKLNKVTLEEGARICRYAFFERVYSKHNVDYCLTAHNMNDDAETLLFNIIRGSGSNGASSIAPIKGNILRPLLKINRTEIEDYLKSIDQPYVTDSTNHSNEYTRNYIRNVLVPNIQNINPSAIEAISRYIDSCRCDRDYFDNEVEKSLHKDLRTLHKAVRDRVVLKKCKDFTGESLNSSMLKELEKALFLNKRCIIPLFEGFEAIVQEGTITFYKSELIDQFKFDNEDLSFGMNMVFGNRVIINLCNDNNYCCENFNKISISEKLSFDNIVGGLHVRNRREGDKICIHGINKSLKKLFIEKKIPKEYRNIIPILFDDKGIIYVPFVGIADRAYPSNCSVSKTVNITFNTIDTERWINAYEK